MWKIFCTVIIPLSFLNYGYAQFFSVRTDLLNNIAGNINLGVDINLSPKLSLETSAHYSVYDNGIFAGVKPAVQAGIRYWFFETSAGHYLGVHYLLSQYRKKSADYRYNGTANGGGLSYGYQWILSNRWNVFAEAGFGISWCRESRNDRHPDPLQDIIIMHRRKTVLHPSRLGVGFTYLF